MLSESSPVPGGILTLNDLELRADAAYKAHMNTYTAGTVLFHIVAFLPSDQDEKELVAAVGTVRAALDTYRRMTRQEWRDSYRRWADAAGVEVDDDVFSDPPDVSDIVSGGDQ